MKLVSFPVLAASSEATIFLATTLQSSALKHTIE
jgi:hypothetical protein